MHARDERIKAFKAVVPLNPRSQNLQTLFIFRTNIMVLSATTALKGDACEDEKKKC